MRVLIFGVSGMLGNAVFREFASDPARVTTGTVRSPGTAACFSVELQSRLRTEVDVLDEDQLIAAFGAVRPELVINCTGIIKQLASAHDPRVILPINSIFPHRLAALCAATGARMIQLSSDCVFSGRQGNYKESDPSDAEDLYGKSKYIGEIHDLPHVVTLRTSGIGHELRSAFGLLEWFLAQRGPVRGFARAIYSGLTSTELARVINRIVVPRPDLHGLYHISSAPIAKLELLRLIARVYGKQVTIDRDDSVAVDRSLNSLRFTESTGYIAPTWPELIALTHANRLPYGREGTSHV